jgi:hypothetical protein
MIALSYGQTEVLRPAEFHAVVQVPWPRIASADDDLLIRLFGYIVGDRG